MTKADRYRSSYNHFAVTQSLATDRDESSPTPSRPRVNRVTLTTHPGRFPQAPQRGTGESPCHRTGSWADVHVPRIHNPSSRRDGVRSVPKGSPRPRNSRAREAVHERTGQRLRNVPRMPRGAGTVTQSERGGVGGRGARRRIRSTRIPGE